MTYQQARDKAMFEFARDPYTRNGEMHPTFYWAEGAKWSRRHTLMSDEVMSAIAALRCICDDLDIIGCTQTERKHIQLAKAVLANFDKLMKGME